MAVLHSFTEGMSLEDLKLILVAVVDYRVKAVVTRRLF